MEIILIILLMYLTIALFVYLSITECDIEFKNKIYEGNKCKILVSLFWFLILIYSIIENKIKFK